MNENYPLFPEDLKNRGYVFEKQLSCGTQSFTTLIKDSENNFYVLKQPARSNLSSEQKFRLKMEAQALETLDGRSTPRVLLWAASPRPFILLEWIEGKTLTQFISGVPHSLKLGMEIVIQLCEILAHVHEAGIVHRDIKPDNIMVGEGQRITLIDFGICKIDAEDADFKTQAGSELGNRFLRLPELGKGEKNPSSASDITFCVGIFFFIITGQSPNLLLDANMTPPHKAEKNRALLAKPKWLSYLFDKGFAYDTSKRFQSAEELMSFLNRWNGATEDEKTNKFSEELDLLSSSSEWNRRENIEAAIIEAQEKFVTKCQLPNASRFTITHNTPHMVSPRCVQTVFPFVVKSTNETLFTSTLRSMINEDYSIVKVTFQIENQVWREINHETIQTSQILDDYEKLASEAVEEVSRKAILILNKNI
jgi:serine/threonine protein kinase